MYLMRPLYKLPTIAGDEEGDHVRTSISVVDDEFTLFHSSHLYSQADTAAALSYLEGKEEQLFSRIKLLKQEVLAAGKRAGLEPAELQNLVEVSTWFAVCIGSCHCLVNKYSRSSVVRTPVANSD